MLFCCLIASKYLRFRGHLIYRKRMGLFMTLVLPKGRLCNVAGLCTPEVVDCGAYGQLNASQVCRDVQTGTQQCNVAKCCVPSTFGAELTDQECLDAGLGRW